MEKMTVVAPDQKLSGYLVFWQSCVYDVCEPEETFDPKSPRSIARAVMRFLDISVPHRKVKGSDDCVNYIFHSKIDGVNNGKD